MAHCRSSIRKLLCSLCLGEQQSRKPLKTLDAPVVFDPTDCYKQSLREECYHGGWVLVSQTV